MSGSATILIQGTVTGVPFAGGGIGPWAITTTTPLNYIWQDPLASGSNTITVPVISGVTPTVVIIVPPVGNATAIRYKTVVGDTGSYINPALPSLYSLDPANLPTSLYLVAASAITGQVSVLII